MARSVEFQGRVIVHPGAEAFVDVSGMVQPNADLDQIAGLIAEAPDGQPGVIHIFADEKAARDYFGIGSDAANGVLFLTKKSPDDRVAQGAGLVYVYKPNVTRRAEFWQTHDPVRDLEGNSLSGAPLQFTTVGAAKKSGTTNAYVDILLPAGAIDDQLENMIIEVSSGWGKRQQRQIKTCRVSGLNWRISLRDDQDWDVAPFLAGVTTQIQIKVPSFGTVASVWGPKGLLNEESFAPADNADPDAGYLFNSKFDGRTELIAEAVGGTLTPKMFLRLDPTDGVLDDTSGWMRPSTAEFTTTVASTGTVLTGAAGLVVNEYQNRYLIVTEIDGGNDDQIPLLGRMFLVASNTATTVTLSGTGLGVNPGVNLKYRLIQITSAVMQITGRNGAAESLEILFNDAGDPAFNGGSGEASFSVCDLTQASTMQALRDKLNQVPNLDATLGDAVDPALPVSRFDFGEASDHWRASVLQGPSATFLGTVLRDNVQSVVDWINFNSGRIVAFRAVGPGSTDSTKGYQDEIGGGEPDNQNGVFRRLYGGDIGISRVRKADSTDTNEIESQRISWERGLELLNEVDEIRTEVLAASEDLQGWDAGDIETLITDFKDHLLDAEAARQYRNGYLGIRYPLKAGTYQGQTFDRGLLDWIRLIDDERMSISGQEVRAFDTTGNEVWLPAWAFPCLCASIQLGTDLGEGLTLKQLGITDFRQPFNDWTPKDVVQGREAVLGALLYLNTKRRTFRIVRGSTSKVSSNNLARTDINVWEIRNELIRVLSAKLEDRFGGAGIGAPGEGVRFVAPASSASIREAVSTELDEQRAEGVIVDSEDETGRRVKAYQGLRVNITGDIARIRVQVFPKTALNFILIDFNFQLPVLSAA